MSCVWCSHLWRPAWLQIFFIHCDSSFTVKETRIFCLQHSNAIRQIWHQNVCLTESDLRYQMIPKCCELRPSCSAQRHIEESVIPARPWSVMTAANEKLHLSRWPSEYAQGMLPRLSPYVPCTCKLSLHFTQILEHVCISSKPMPKITAHAVVSISVNGTLMSCRWSAHCRWTTHWSPVWS